MKFKLDRNSKLIVFLWFMDCMIYPGMVCYVIREAEGIKLWKKIWLYNLDFIVIFSWLKIDVIFADWRTEFLDDFRRFFDSVLWVLKPWNFFFTFSLAIVYALCINSLQMKEKPAFWSKWRETGVSNWDFTSFIISSCWILSDTVNATQ